MIFKLDRFIGPAAVYAAFAAVGLAFSWMSTSFSFGTAKEPGPAVIPLLVSVCVFGVSLGLMIRLFVTGDVNVSSQQESDEGNELAPEWVAAIVWFGLLIYPITAPYLGHLASSFLTGLVIQLAIRVSPIKSVIVASAFSVASYYIFSVALQQPLP